MMKVQRPGRWSQSPFSPIFLTNQDRRMEKTNCQWPSAMTRDRRPGYGLLYHGTCLTVDGVPVHLWLGRLFWAWRKLLKTGTLGPPQPITRVAIGESTLFGWLSASGSCCQVLANGPHQRQWRRVPRLRRLGYPGTAGIPPGVLRTSFLPGVPVPNTR